MLKIVFFAALKEKLNSEGLTLDLEKDECKVGDLKQKICDLHPEWSDALIDNSVLCAVNHTMVNDSFDIKSGDEVAFFPPVTGG